MPKDWERVDVTADKFAQVRDSYSGDTIADSKTVRKPFKHEGRFYVSTGGVSGGNSIPCEEAYELVGRQDFSGEAKWYGQKLREVTTDDEEEWSAQRRAQPRGFYHGMLVKRGKSEWVLVGPPLVFVVREGSSNSKQLELF